MRPRLDTTAADIGEKFKALTKRQDIAIIVINQHVRGFTPGPPPSNIINTGGGGQIAEEIRPLIDAHEATVPTVVIIPSKGAVRWPLSAPGVCR